MQRRGTRRVLLGVMLTISLAAMGAWAQTAPAKAKLERLKIAVAPLGWDTNFTWLQSRSGQLAYRKFSGVGCWRANLPITPGASSTLGASQDMVRYYAQCLERCSQLLRPMK